MIQGLYAAANGMLSVEDRQAVISNNIVNSTTHGFKRQVAVQTGYYQSFFGKSRSAMRLNLETAPGGGVRTVETFSNYSNGVITPTGNPLDLALIGPGFLRVLTPEGVRLTRSGRMSISEGGQLVTADGHVVLSEDELPIDVSGGNVEIDGEGNVLVDGEPGGRISVIEFEDPHVLAREGYSLFRASDEALEQALPADNTTMVASALEASNVQLPAEMAQMLMALRAYAANQRVITAIDETASRLINQVGAPS